MARIIIADDDKLTQAIYRNAIDFLGHEPVICQNGLEAVESFADEPSDLVLLDMLMPKMDGIEACRRIRKMPKGSNVPIIIVSSLDDEKDIVRGLNAGANDYLLKPVKDSNLFAKLKIFLRMSSLHKDDFELAKRHAVFADRFKIVKMLGYGTHSIVFLAEDLEDGGNKTALKLFKNTAETASVFDSFAETAGKLKQVDSKYVLKIRDFGQCDGRMFVAMDYAGQGDLARMLKKGPCSQLVAARVGFDISSAIRDISSRGIIHFDIKPENVMINEGRYLLGDFGIITTRVSATLPIGKEIWGTLAYLPPEYLTEDKMKLGQSDVYSLGITLYEALSGKNPFSSERAGTTMFSQMNLVPPPITDWNPSYDPELSGTLARMLLKKAPERPSPEDLVEIFGSILERFPKEPDRDCPLPILLLPEQEQEEGGEGITSFPSSKEKIKGVPKIIQCFSCGNLAEKTILRTAGLKCSKCGSSVGIARRCKKCGRIFPMDYDGTPAKGMKEESNCIECSSSDTEPVPTSAEYLEILMRESEKAQSRRK